MNEQLTPLDLWMHPDDALAPWKQRGFVSVFEGASKLHVVLDMEVLAAYRIVSRDVVQPIAAAWLYAARAEVVKTSRVALPSAAAAWCLCCGSGCTDRRVAKGILVEELRRYCDACGARDSRPRLRACAASDCAQLFMPTPSNKVFCCEACEKATNRLPSERPHPLVSAKTIAGGRVIARSFTAAQADLSPAELEAQLLAEQNPGVSYDVETPHGRVTYRSAAGPGVVIHAPLEAGAILEAALTEAGFEARQEPAEERRSVEHAVGEMALHVLEDTVSAALLAALVAATRTALERMLERVREVVRRSGQPLRKVTVRIYGARGEVLSEVVVTEDDGVTTPSQR